MAIKLLGIVDDGDCECCGKRDLKRRVVLDIDGDVVKFGSECAARRLGRRSKVAVEREAVKAQTVADAKALERAFWTSFLADDVRVEAAFRTHVGNLSFEAFVAQLHKHAALANRENP